MPLGIDSGVVVRPIDTFIINALPAGCGVETTLSRPFHVTGVKVYENATDPPVLADEHIRVYYKNENGENVFIPAVWVSLTVVCLS